MRDFNILAMKNKIQIFDEFRDHMDSGRNLEIGIAIEIYDAVGMEFANKRLYTGLSGGWDSVWQMNSHPRSHRINSFAVVLLPSSLM